MLRQTAKQRLQSRIVLYCGVIALVWVMEKMGEAHKPHFTGAPSGIELVAYQPSE